MNPLTLVYHYCKPQPMAIECNSGEVVRVTTRNQLLIDQSILTSLLLSSYSFWIVFVIFIGNTHCSRIFYNDGPLTQSKGVNAVKGFAKVDKIYHYTSFFRTFITFCLGEKLWSIRIFSWIKWILFIWVSRLEMRTFRGTVVPASVTSRCLVLSVSCLFLAWTQLTIVEAAGQKLIYSL